ncbi:MAG: hypothetical protein IEMM0002_0876 [bacterium]|nr:MAG: hypothetical protein IEMM0002_0876 [bacterium]
MTRGNLPQRGGFTFIEVLMVMVIAGIIAAVALPVFNVGSSASLGAEVVAGDIRFTQWEAINKNKTLSLSTVGSSEYHYANGRSRDLREFGSLLTLDKITITFNSLGEPAATQPQTIGVTDGAGIVYVDVAPYTGRVTLR